MYTLFTLDLCLCVYVFLDHEFSQAAKRFWGSGEPDSSSYVALKSDGLYDYGYATMNFVCEGKYNMLFSTQDASGGCNVQGAMGNMICRVQCAMCRMQFARCDVQGTMGCVMCRVQCAGCNAMGSVMCNVQGV